MGLDGVLGVFDGCWIEGGVGLRGVVSEGSWWVLGE